jgi:large subunit ribosomal protein L7/L12
MADIKKIADELSSLTIMEAADLVKHLEESWGVKAASFAPVAAAAAGASASAAQEEKTEFDVVLASIGDKKLDVIKVVREITALGLKEAKDLVESAPQPIKKQIQKKEAEEIKAKLEAAGAKVELK